MFIERPNGLVRLHMLLQGVVTLLLMVMVFAVFQFLNAPDGLTLSVYLRYAAIFAGAMVVEYAARSHEQGNLFALTERRRFSLVKSNSIFL